MKHSTLQPVSWSGIGENGRDSGLYVLVSALWLQQKTKTPHGWQLSHPLTGTRRTRACPILLFYWEEGTQLGRGELWWFGVWIHHNCWRVDASSSPLEKTPAEGALNKSPVSSTSWFLLSPSYLLPPSSCLCITLYVAWWLSGRLTSSPHQ